MQLVAHLGRLSPDSVDRIHRVHQQGAAPVLPDAVEGLALYALRSAAPVLSRWIREPEFAQASPKKLPAGSL